MKLKIVRISPKTAADWLKKNTNNRPVRETHIAYLTSVIDSGKWMVNGETIKFDSSGNLQDGQHRLLAILRSGKAVCSAVAYDVGDANCNGQVDVFDTIDVGSPRSNADLLSRRGYKNACLLSSAASHLYRFIWSRGETIRHGRLKVSFFEINAILKKHPELTEVASKLQHTKAARFIGASYAVFLRHVFAKASTREAAESFFRMLSTGEELTARHPIMVLREQLVSVAIAKGMTMDSVCKSAITIKAWNAYCSNSKIRHLKWSQDEAFPKIANIEKSGLFEGPQQDG